MRIVVTGGRRASSAPTSSATCWSSIDRRDRPCSTSFTYAGNLDNLVDVPTIRRYSFVKGGHLATREVVDRVAAGADAIVNFAAETHVDRRSAAPSDFIPAPSGSANARAARGRAGARASRAFSRSRTAEVLRPTSPRAASVETDVLPTLEPLLRPARPAAELLVLAYPRRTYGRPAGPYQSPQLQTIRALAVPREEIVPLVYHQTPSTAIRWPSTATVATCATGSTSTTTAGARTWSCAKDVTARSLQRRRRNEVANLDLTRGILTELGWARSSVPLTSPDRPATIARLRARLRQGARPWGWEPRVGFAEGLARTVAWYADHRAWWGEDQVGRVGAGY